jgi:NADH-quinone oxidoreductase subunit D
MHDYLVPLGPQHPALIEPVHIKLSVDGEKIVGSELVLGYNHKGIEKSFENRWWAKGVYLSERVCGICGHYHTSCYCQGVENLLGIEIPHRAKYIRIIVGELERLHSHLLALGVVAWEIGLDTLFHYIFRDRELVMDMQELLSGNRVHFAMNVIGGARRDVNLDQIKDIEGKLEKLDDRVNHYIDIFRNDASIKNRIKHVGYLSKQKAKELNPVGPNVRASGIDYDVRETDYLPYSELKFKVITGEGGDVLERCLVRWKECTESIHMIHEALLTLPKGDLAIKVPPIIKIKEGLETMSRVEAPRGELIYYLRSAGDKPYRVKIRTPTYQTFHILDEIIRGYEIPDVPPILASIDPCFSCTDRMTVVDVNTKKEKIVTKHDILHMREDHRD